MVTGENSNSVHYPPMTHLNVALGSSCHAVSPSRTINKDKINKQPICTFGYALVGCHGNQEFLPSPPQCAVIAHHATINIPPSILHRQLQAKHKS
jgi:hypothetical protein